MFLPGTAGLAIMLGLVAGVCRSDNTLDLTLTRFITAPGKAREKSSSFELNLASGQTAEVRIAKDTFTVAPVANADGSLTVAFKVFSQATGLAASQVVNTQVIVKPGETAVVPAGAGQEFEIAAGSTPEPNYFGSPTPP